MTTIDYPVSSDVHELSKLADRIRETHPLAKIWYWSGVIAIRQLNGNDVVAYAGESLRWDEVRIWRPTSEWERNCD